MVTKRLPNGYQNICNRGKLIWFLGLWQLAIPQCRYILEETISNKSVIQSLESRWTIGQLHYECPSTTYISRSCINAKHQEHGRVSMVVIAVSCNNIKGTEQTTWSIMVNLCWYKFDGSSVMQPKDASFVARFDSQWIPIGDTCYQTFAPHGNISAPVFACTLAMAGPWCSHLSAGDIWRWLRGWETRRGKVQSNALRIDSWRGLRTYVVGTGIVAWWHPGSIAKGLGTDLNHGFVCLFQPGLLYHRGQAGRSHHQQCVAMFAADFHLAHQPYAGLGTSNCAEVAGHSAVLSRWCFLGLLRPRCGESRGGWECAVGPQLSWHLSLCDLCQDCFGTISPPDSHSLGHDVCKCDDGHFSRKSQQLLRLHSLHMSTHGHTRLHLRKLPGFMFSLVGASDCRSSPGILDHLPKHLSLFPTHLGQSLRPSWLHSGIHCPAAFHQYPS